LLGCLRESRQFYRITADAPSRLRLIADVWESRILAIRPRTRLADRQRRVRLCDGTRLTYRLNRGDLQGIREVWCEEAYRLPFDRLPRTFVDLGANIGLTTVWMCRNYGCDRVV